MTSLPCRCEHCGNEFDAEPKGGHKILCGDSTKAEDVARLLGDVKPHLMVTDPPYGVSYDPAWRNATNFSPNRATGTVANDDTANWSGAWALFPGDVAYVWHGALHATVVADNLMASGFMLRGQIIWAKQNQVFSRGDYHWKHEPCWYVVRKGKTGHWAGDRKQTTLWEIANHNPMGGNTDEKSTGHGTQKPVECMKRPIENNSSAGQSVYEPFCGSGTTIIAGEMTGRSILALEIDPAYVDVAVRRWCEFSGQKATDENGRAFDEVAAERMKVAA
jgi:DNA modification methylase